ncbi:hypothetical protein [Aliarcobacter butzleri]|uniref:hypothetical protein n=1 Tax=Aliarcobacter butzleri TaxID=28197 RepID=UPI002B251745|nr:hypothetical protein [Aliarcobacter butzleri]
MRKASFSVEKVSSNTDAHNTREHSPKYLLGCEQDNPNVYIKYYDYEEFQTLAENRYVEVNNQKMQQKQKDSMFEEALISLEKNHTEKDIENLFKDLNKKFTGHTLINLAIHRDEGHFEKDGIEYYPTKHILQKDDGWYILDEDDTEILQALQDKDFKPKNEDFKVKVNIEDFNKVYNYHAHAVFSRFDLELGKSARLQKKDMSERYKFVAEKMQMRYAPDESRFVKKSINQYKNDKSNSRNERLILKKQLENEHQKELEKLRDENKSLKIENQALKIDNEALKYRKKELEEEIKNLSKNLREALKELGASRPHYAQLEQMNKELKEELKNNALKHENILKSYQDLEKNLREEITKKDEKIDTLENENQDLKSALEALKYQLDLKEKRNQSYFGLNQDLKNEIIALKSQINALEEEKEDLEEKVASKPNMSQGEQYLEEMTNKYSKASPEDKEQKKFKRH